MNGFFGFFGITDQSSTKPYTAPPPAPASAPAPVDLTVLTKGVLTQASGVVTQLRGFFESLNSTSVPKKEITAKEKIDIYAAKIIGLEGQFKVTNEDREKVHILNQIDKTENERFGLIENELKELNEKLTKDKNSDVSKIRKEISENEATRDSFLEKKYERLNGAFTIIKNPTKLGDIIKEIAEIEIRKVKFLKDELKELNEKLTNDKESDKTEIQNKIAKNEAQILNLLDTRYLKLEEKLQQTTDTVLTTIIIAERARIQVEKNSDFVAKRIKLREEAYENPNLDSLIASKSVTDSLNSLSSLSSLGGSSVSTTQNQKPASSRGPGSPLSQKTSTPQAQPDPILWQNKTGYRFSMIAYDQNGNAITKKNPKDHEIGYFVTEIYDISKGSKSGIIISYPNGKNQMLYQRNSDSIRTDINPYYVIDNGPQINTRASGFPSHLGNIPSLSGKYPEILKQYTSFPQDLIIKIYDNQEVIMGTRKSDEQILREKNNLAELREELKEIEKKRLEDIELQRRFEKAGEEARHRLKVRAAEIERQKESNKIDARLDRIGDRLLKNNISDTEFSKLLKISGKLMEKQQRLLPTKPSTSPQPREKTGIEVHTLRPKDDRGASREVARQLAEQPPGDFAAYEFKSKDKKSTGSVGQGRGNGR
jgi:hypothetical protein